jgi:8-oxo-dGTP pyrophosphatase MutT (NUDIX family)
MLDEFPILKSIIEKLKGPLPGESAQKELFPAHRLAIYDQESSWQHAAVLILIYPENNELKTLLIKRPEYDGHHSGQIAFPGGKKEWIDTSLEETALREFKEEVGIGKDIHIIGKLSPLFIPISRFQVLPFVGYIDYTPKPVPEISEVAYTIDVKLKDLLTAEKQKKRMQIGFESYEIPYFNLANETVWGATAMIISEFRHLLKNEQT